MSPNERICLLDELQRLLEGQIELARQGKLGELEDLGRQAGVITEEIGRAGILEQAEFDQRRKLLARLYQELRLTLSNQRDEVSRELDRIRRGRKTIGVYRDSIQIAGK